MYSENELEQNKEESAFYNQPINTDFGGQEYLIMAPYIIVTLAVKQLKYQQNPLFCRTDYSKSYTVSSQTPDIFCYPNAWQEKHLCGFARSRLDVEYVFMFQIYSLSTQQMCQYVYFQDSLQSNVFLYLMTSTRLSKLVVFVYVF